MTKKTEKLHQPAKGKSIKVFDVGKPGKPTAPSASSRPVIVSNRPIMQDPMVTGEHEAKTASKAPPEKIVIKPLSTLEKAEPETSGRINLNIPDFSPREKSKAEPLPAAPETSKAAEPAEAAPPAEPQTAEEPATAPEPDDVPPSPAEEESQSKKPDEEEPPEKPDEETPAADPTTDTVTDASKDEKQTAALEAEVKRQDELNKLVESKEYFLPINTVERRRSKIVTLFGLLLIILLGLLLVNLLMDLGTIRIKGVEPVTHFFSS